MPSKFLLRNFTPGHTYHLRHVAAKSSPLFTDLADYKSFILTLSYYLRFPDGAPLSWVPRLNPRTLAAKQGSTGPAPCTLHAFLLLPDHFHLVLTESVGGKKSGISELMRRLSVGYAMTYRKKHGGTGTIYQGKYKQTILDDNHQAALIAYLHSHPGVNPTYLNSPFHSSAADYGGTPRSWLKPLPLNNPLPPPQIITLE